MSVVLITGASSGIGRELARLHAEAGDELVVVARREKALRELRDGLEAAHGTVVHVLAEDLADPHAPGRIEKTVHRLGLDVDVLVNNAGFGGHGAFHERDRQEDLDMVQVNIAALTELTKRFLPGMVERGHGKVLNVASTAAFLPGPLQAVYYASKAYVLSLSEALAEELRGSGVTVTALCPGPVDTGFEARAGLQHTGLFRGAPSAREVAEYGYAAMQKGTVVAVHGAAFKVLMPSLRLVPRGLVRRVSRRTME